MGVSSVDVTSGNRSLVRLLRPADTGVAGVRRSGRGGRTGDSGGGRKGRNRSRVGRTVIGKAGNLGASNDEPIEGVGPDVGPLEPVVHPREAGELAGGWLVSASVLHIDLNAAWVVLGLSGRVKSNNLIANQVLSRGEPSGNCRSPLVAISNQLLRGPFSTRISAFIDLNHLPSVALKPEQSPLQEAIKVVTGPR